MLVVDAAGAVRHRVPRRRAVPRRRDRRQRPVPRRRAPPRLQRVRAGLRPRRRRAAADRVDPVPPRRHRRRAWPAATTCSPRTSGRRARATRCSRSSTAGRERRDVVLTMRANNRLAGLHRRPARRRSAPRSSASRRLGEIIDAVRRRHGARPRSTGRSPTRDRRFCEEIAGWPDGTYEADVYVDSDPAGNRDIHVHVAITVDGDRLIVDFAGLRRRGPRSRRGRRSATRAGYTIAQLASPRRPVDPEERGLLRLHRPARAARLLREPASRASRSSSGTHHPGVEVGDAIALAMSQILPDRCAPQTYKYGSPRQMWGDLDPRTGTPFFDHGGEINAGWVNGVKGVDGWGALVASNGNLIKASAEINEVLFPHILRGRNYLTDSGGAGQWRGGCGSHFVKEVRTPTLVNQYVVNQHHMHPGIAGGDDGSPDQCIARATGTDHEIEVAPSVAGRPARDRRTARVPTSAAAAAGAIRCDRDPQAVLDDVWDEYVSIEAARARLRRGRSPAPSTTDARPRRHRDRRAAGEAARDQGRCVSPSTEAGYRIGVDVGGTFTDLVLLRADGTVRAGEDADDAAATSPRACSTAWRAWRRPRGSPASATLLAATTLDRARHHDGRQHDDPDVGRADRTARHRGLPRRDRVAALLQGGHLGPRLPRARADRAPSGPPRDPRAGHRRGRRRHAARRGRPSARRRRGCARSASRRSRSRSCTRT